MRPAAVNSHAIVLLFALFLAGSAQAGVVPGFDRPGLGFSPDVLQAGGLIWEQGLPDYSYDDGSSLYAADTLLRYGLGNAAELQLGTAYNHQTIPGDDISGRTGTSLGIKFALPTLGALSTGLLGSVTLTDGSSEFSIDEPEYLLGAAFNWQLDARNALGAYLETTYSEDHDDQLIALNAGHALASNVGGYVEIAWQHLDDAGSGSMAGAGLTWAVIPRAQLDLSFRHRIAGSANQWEAGFGVSIYFGRMH